MTVWYQHLAFPFWQRWELYFGNSPLGGGVLCWCWAKQCHKEPQPAGCSITSLYFTSWVLTFKTRDKTNCHIISRTLEGIHLAQFQVTPQVRHPEQPREGGAGISRILHCSISQNNFLVVEQWTIFGTRASNSFILTPANLAHMELISSTLSIPQTPDRSQIILCCNSSLRHQPTQGFASQLPLDSKTCFFYCKHYSSHSTRLLLSIPQVTLLKLCFGWGSTITLPAGGSLGRVCCDPGMEQYILQGQAMEGVVLQELGN